MTLLAMRATMKLLMTKMMMTRRYRASRSMEWKRKRRNWERCVCVCVCVCVSSSLSLYVYKALAVCVQCRGWEQLVLGVFYS